jgi:WD40 repeat protein
LVTALVGHSAAIHEASFNREGSLIVTASRDATARVWEARTGGNTLRLEHAGPVTSAEFSADGNLIATASEDRTARLWNAATGKLLAELKHDDDVRNVRLSPDGKFVVTITALSSWIWDAHTYQKLTQLFMPETGSVDGGMKMARFSPDGSRIVIGNEVGRVGVWNTKGKFLVELEGHTQSINSISFNQDGGLIATASVDETARVWDATNGKNLFIMQGPQGMVRYADFSSDDRFVVTSNQDNSAWVWDRLSRLPITQLVGSDSAINVAKFSPDGKLILTGSGDRDAYLYNCEVCDSPQTLLDLARKRATRDLRPEEQRVFSR